MAKRPERTKRERPARAGRVQRDPLADKIKRDEEKKRRKIDQSNPMADVEMTGNAEVDSKATHDKYLEEAGSLSSRNKAEGNRFRLATDSEFYVVTVFQTRAQKEHFLRETGWDAFGDKYLSGDYVAAKCGVTFPEEDHDNPDNPQNEATADVEVPYNTGGKIDKDYLKLMRDDV